MELCYGETSYSFIASQEPQDEANQFEMEYYKSLPHHHHMVVPPSNAIVDINDLFQQQQSGNYRELQSLPFEILLHIMQYLEVESLVQVSRTNHLFNYICNDDELWKYICINKFGWTIKKSKSLYSDWKTFYRSFNIYKGSWDSNKMGKMILSNNKKSITHAGDYLGSYQSARGTLPIKSGLTYWEFQVNCLNANQTGFHLVIGLVPESFSIWQTYLTSNGGWGYLADGRKAYNSGNGVSYAQGFAQGSVVGVLVDMNLKTMTFYHNGKCQGVAFTNVEGTVYPGVSLLTGGQSISFIDNPQFPKLDE
ncbi:hypothetical protein CYY_004739 [Polysphondylium violaceum]|uniref:F-box domain-containing protein n=1 Tax=Polysphondylium violaceum TaxID=133409 RepID=A0A8J4V4V4_9MYCE|nr:hypothetical protein CYY_004739 [Polysphondylium violaceum]